VPRKIDPGTDIIRVLINHVTCYSGMFAVYVTLGGNIVSSVRRAESNHAGS
jgi:hypothetical protein